jgi:hypothetical protein
VPYISGILGSDGPTLDVHLAIYRAEEQRRLHRGGVVPAALSLKALIDTGSTICFARTGTASRLGIRPVGITQVATGSQIEVAFVYLMRVLLPGNHEFEFKLAELPMPAAGIQCLLGQEFLARGTFTQNGPQATWSFAW